LGKLLVVLGLVTAGIGVAVMAGVPLGRLPGDFVIRRGSATVYVPLVTSLVVSIILTLLFAVFRR
jgi:uncharacterized protein HemY